MKMKDMKRILGFILIGTFVLVPLCAPAQGPHHWHFPKGSTWQLSDGVVQEIRATIEHQVRDIAKRAGKELRPWAEYSFQLQGQEQDGRKYVYINALCNRQDESIIDSLIIVVLDGGNCFFNVKYDPIHKVYYDLFINGEA